MVTGTLHLSLVFFMVSGLLWFYSTTYKRQVILGTTIVSLLTALVPVVVLLFEIPLVIDEYGPSANAVMKNIAVWVSGFALFAFLLNFIREIVKDAEDYNGDAVFKKKTLPVVAGMRITKAVITIIIVFTLVLLIISYLYFVPDKYTLIYFLAFLAIPLVIAGIKVAPARAGRISTSKRDGKNSYCNGHFIYARCKLYNKEAGMTECANISTLTAIISFLLLHPPEGVSFLPNSGFFCCCAKRK
jgi:4-hydroxybenzoate polyprenyltransferase